MQLVQDILDDFLIFHEITFALNSQQRMIDLQYLVAL